MARGSPTIPELLDALEIFHGRQEPCWPVEPYEFVVWWNCGYPASDTACAMGWEALRSNVGIEPDKVLQATPRKLAAALQRGGSIPELRALRLKEIAMRVNDEFGGDLRSALAGPMPIVRKRLKSFPGIADPGADRILLFAGIKAIAAVPSNCPQVLVRLVHGEEQANYTANYREAQRLIAGGVPETIDARIRAYLLLKQHGQEICKRSRPKCEECPVRAKCRFVVNRTP